jgi:hypothetical protein
MNQFLTHFPLITIFIFKFERGQLYQRVNSALISHPYGLSLIVPAFMMTDEAIQIVLIKLLYFVNIAEICQS